MIKNRLKVVPPKLATGKIEKRSKPKIEQVSMPTNMSRVVGLVGFACFIQPNQVLVEGKLLKVLPSRSLAAKMVTLMGFCYGNLLLL